MKTHEFRDWLLEVHYHTVDADRLDVIRAELERVVRDRVVGSVVELGCFRGAMSAWMRWVLDDLCDPREIHVYDSFEGLPAPGPLDSDHLKQGEICSSVDELLGLHSQWSLCPPTIHRGWFVDTLPGDLPPTIAFGYIDGDFYDSITVSLHHCVPLLTSGAALIVDDYADVEANPKAWDGLPGVKRACDDYFGAPLEVIVGEGDLAFGAYRSPHPSFGSTTSADADGALR